MIEKGDPFFVNVQGEGGSGKSFIINYLSALYPDRTIRTAYTAKAANLIFGVHLHKQFNMKYDMKPKEIDELKKELGNRDIIIVDESSFIGINAICVLDDILQKVANNNESFGNYKIIWLGDFNQLKCVGDKEI